MPPKTAELLPLPEVVMIDDDVSAKQQITGSSSSGTADANSQYYW